MSARPSMYLPRAPQLRRGEVLGAADVEDDLLAAGDEVDGGGELLHGVGGDDDGDGAPSAHQRAHQKCMRARTIRAPSTSADFAVRRGRFVKNSRATGLD